MFYKMPQVYCYSNLPQFSDIAQTGLDHIKSGSLLATRSNNWKNAGFQTPSWKVLRGDLDVDEYLASISRPGCCADSGLDQKIFDVIAEMENQGEDRAVILTYFGGCTLCISSIHYSGMLDVKGKVAIRLSPIYTLSSLRIVLNAMKAQ